MRDISVGSGHVLALTADGEVYGWGRDDNGQLGGGSGPAVPAPVPLLQGRNIVGIACGPNQVNLAKAFSKSLA